MNTTNPRKGLGCVPEVVATEWAETSSKDPQAFGVVVESNEMAPRICPGDRIILEAGIPVENGDIALVLLKRGCLHLRRYFSVDQRIQLRAENSAFEPVAVSPEETQYAYPVFETIRDER